MAQVQNAIRLKQFFVSAIDFRLGVDVEHGITHEDADKLDVELTHGVGTLPLGVQGFVVQFDLKLTSYGRPPFTLTTKAVAEFETQSEVSEEFIMSTLVQVNAPAIAFPYLRSFISTITLNAGIPAIVLPAMVFHRAQNQEAGRPTQ